MILADWIQQPDTEKTRFVFLVRRKTLSVVQAGQRGQLLVEVQMQFSVTCIYADCILLSN